jgi:hypothetical protein
MLPLIRSLAFAAAKAAGAIILGGAIIWEVALHCGPPRGTVYVHVAGGVGDVTIDESTYHVRTLWESPIVRELQPGRHSVRMSRDGQCVFEEDISINPGEEIMLTAWDRSNERLESEPTRDRPEQVP